MKKVPFKMTSQQKKPNILRSTNSPHERKKIRTAFKDNPPITFRNGSQGKNSLLQSLPVLLTLFILAPALFFLFHQAPLAATLYKRQHIKSLSKLKKGGYWGIAGDIYLQQGKEQEALLAFLKARSWKEAADIYLKQQHHKKAAELYAYTNHWELAARTYEKAQQYQLAAKAYQHLQQHENFMRCLKKAKLWSQVAKEFEKQGLSAKALNAHKKAGEWEKKGNLHYERKDWLKAIQAYQKAKKPNKVAQIHLHRKKLSLAANSFLNGGINRCAGVIKARQRKNREAARLFMSIASTKGGFELYQLAAKVIERSRSFSKSRRWLGKSILIASRYQQHQEMLELYEKQGALRRGIRIINKKGKRLAKTGQYVKAERLYRVLKDFPALIIAEKLPLQQKWQRLQRKIRYRPSLQLNRPMTRIDSQSGKFKIKLKGRIDIPDNFKASSVNLICIFFKKNLGPYLANGGRGISSTDFCRTYRGSWHRIKAFEKASSGRITQRKITNIHAGETKKFSFEQAFPVPYKNIRCYVP